MPKVMLFLGLHVVQQGNLVAVWTLPEKITIPAAPVIFYKMSLPCHCNSVEVFNT